jgi:hypothetical protein
MLTSGRRTALPRHQTLRATLDWSYELLPERERLIMRRLAVFAGNFTAEAASLVAAGGEIAASEVIRSLANLVTKSLVTLEVGSVSAHYRLHETTRAYAHEKLAEGGEFEQVARRHANYYRDLFDRAEIELETLPAPAWLAAYGHQIVEVRAGLDWAFSPTGDAEIGVALTVAAVPLWVQLSLMEECRSRVERALSGPAESRDARRNMQLYAALGAALFLTKGSCPEISSACTSAFEIAESLDDADYRLRALWGLFVACFTSGRYRAALAVAERFCTYAATDPADGPIGDRLVGAARLVLGDLDGARRHIERMLGRYVAIRSHIIRFQYDQRLLAHSYHSRILWLQVLELLRLWWREGKRRNIMLPHGWLFPGRSRVPGGKIHERLYGALRQGHGGAVERRGSMFRRRLARQARRHWRRVGASAHRIRPLPVAATAWRCGPCAPCLAPPGAACARCRCRRPSARPPPTRAGRRHRRSRVLPCTTAG